MTNAERRRLIETGLSRETDPEKRKFWEREVVIQDHVERFGIETPFVAPPDFFK